MTRWAPPVIAFLLVLLLWELVRVAFAINPVVLPGASSVLSAGLREFPRLANETAVTAIEALLGFLLGTAAAYATAVLFVRFAVVQRALYPYAVALKSTPLIALAPLIVLWFGNDLGSKVVMAALVAFFPVLVNAVVGLQRIDPELIDLMRSFGATDRQLFLKVRVPSSLPYLFAGLRISSSLAVVGALIGEFTGSSHGIGHVINHASYYLQTDLMFAAIACVASFGVGFFSAIAWLERRLVFWQPDDPNGMPRI